MLMCSSPKTDSIRGEKVVSFDSVDLTCPCISVKIQGYFFILTT